MKRVLFCILVGLLGASTIHADIAEEIQSLVAHPQNNATYHYNLGTLYYQARQYGLSAAHLDKAMHLDPWDFDIRANHALAVKKSDAFSNMGWLEMVGDHPLLIQLQGISGIFGLVVLLFWFKAYLRSRKIWFVLARPVGWFGIAVFICMSFFGVAGILSNSRPHAYLLNDLMVRSGPSETFTELKHLQSGSKVRLLGRTAADTKDLNTATPSQNPSTWVQVLYDRKDVGWVPANALLRI